MSEAANEVRIPKIHFAALVGVEVDADILPWWLSHYFAMHLDSYTVFLHESLDENLNNGVEACFQAYDFRVVRVPESALREDKEWSGCPDGVRRTLIGNFARSLHPQDFLITADGDEIQEWTETPREAVSRGVKIMSGLLVDRFDDTLHAPYPRKSLSESYPSEHPNLHSFFKRTPLTQTKICMAPASYPVEYSGSHDLTLGEKFPANCIVSGPIRVLHFRWRESAVKRVKGRKYWKDDEIAAMENFFRVGESQ